MDELYPAAPAGAKRLHLLRLAADAGASLKAARYRGPAAGTLLRADLGGMVAVYDRRAGVTHLLAEPAVVILDALEAGEGEVDALIERLGLGSDDDGEGATELLLERLEELVLTGLVERP